MCLFMSLKQWWDCRRMRPNQLMVPGAVDGTSSAYGWKNCTSPVTYSSLAEGRWGLTFSATDMAGFVQESGYALCTCV